MSGFCGSSHDDDDVDGGVAMPRLHGWMQDGEDPTGWTYGGRFFAAFMWVPTTSGAAVGVRIWPRLGDVASNDLTLPLGAEHSFLTFVNEAAARAYVESWERAGNA